MGLGRRAQVKRDAEDHKETQSEPEHFSAKDRVEQRALFRILHLVNKLFHVLSFYLLFGSFI